MNKIVFWSIFIVTVLTFLLLISNILAPFFIAFILAYILQPLIESSCAALKIPRITAAYGTFILCLGVMALGVLTLLPVVYRQVALLVVKMPAYQHYLQTELAPIIISKMQAIDPDLNGKITQLIHGMINGTFTVIALLLNNLWNYAMLTVNITVIILLVPLILFYFLRDWPKIIGLIDSLLPLQGKSKIKEILAAINQLLSAYVRGQLNVCLLMSTYYGVGLSMIGIDLSLLLGVASGCLIIIPFIGLTISGLLSLIIGYITFGMTTKLSYIGTLYLVGYVVENYFITPRIIGNNIGLHPLWIMFSVFASGSLFGFIGIFFAIPIASIVKILLTFAVDFYQTSRIYRT